MLHPKTNRLGQTYFLSGYSYYLSCYLNIRTCNLRAAPDGDVEGLLDVGTYEEILSIPDKVSLVFDNTVLPDDYLVVVYFAALSGAGRFRSPAGFYKLIGVYDTITDGELEVTTELFSKYGISTLAVGSTLFSYVQYIDTISGLASARQYKNTIVAAA